MRLKIAEADDPTNGTVLWTAGEISCSFRPITDDALQINLVMNRVVVERALFSDTETAASYALRQMDMYGGGCVSD